jgi:predicted phosphodiesterase
MRYAFIADVHANLEALTAVLQAIARLGAESVLCLGDVVGRFANPNVNPGSVGQPRDGDPRASFAIYDSDHAVIRFHRAEFDRRAAEEKALRAGLLLRGEEYLA